MHEARRHLFLIVQKPLAFFSLQLCRLCIIDRTMESGVYLFEDTERSGSKIFE